MSKEQIASDSLKQALSQILNKTMAGVEKGVDFLSAELPEVINQLLLWKMWGSVIGNMLIWICAIIIPAIIFYLNFSKGTKAINKDILDQHGMLLIVSGIWFVLGLIPLGIGTNLVWLQILIAPKIYLIEYAAKLLK